MNSGLFAVAAAAALWSATPAAAAVGPDGLEVIVDETAVHELPGSSRPVVMRLDRGRLPLDFGRLGPGRHDDWGPFVAGKTIGTAAGDERVDVGVVDSGGKSGRVRAAHVGPNYGAEIETQVIDPCIRAGLRPHGPLTGLQEDAAARIARRELAAEWDELSDGIAAVVAGKPRAERKRIYENSLGLCIVAVLGDD